MSPAIFLLAATLTLALPAGNASAHDVPSEIILYGYTKPVDDRLHFLVRLPLIMLQNIALPTRGPGYVDLSKIGPKLKQTIAAISREVEFFEDGRQLTFDYAKARISQESDRSFETYDTALANIEGPPLPQETNVFWNQGFLDAHLVYPIRSQSEDFSLDLGMSGFGKILKLKLTFIPAEGSPKTYELVGGFGRLALDPRWHQVGFLFVKFGFFDILNSMETLLFIFCLLIPIRRLRDLWPVVIAFTISHSITLIGSASGLLPRGGWFPLWAEVLVALSILYVSIENIAGANLHRRWIVAGVFGLVYGFKFWFGLHHNLQLSGTYRVLTLLSFNAGIEFGQIFVLLIVFPLLGFLLKHPTAERFGVIVLSALSVHTAWHWLLEHGALLRRLGWPKISLAGVVILIGGIVLLIGVAAWMIRSWRTRRIASRKSDMNGRTTPVKPTDIEMPSKRVAVK